MKNKKLIKLCKVSSDILAAKTKAYRKYVYKENHPFHELEVWTDKIKTWNKTINMDSPEEIK